MSIAMATAKPSGRKLAAERADRTFEQLAEPFRRELKVHCYRMLGSLHEAEDSVQETYLRAWRSFSSFDGRGSFRAWLYRIATNACLDALAQRKQERRFLPDQRAPATSEMPNGRPAPDVEWLEPYPSAELDGIADDAPNPEARYTARQAVQLAFVAVIQQLPPRQRAVLLLCDVLGWSAAEAATLLSGSTASVNSALQRAREALARSHADGGASLVPADDPARKKLLGRYVQAWESLDLEGFVSLLKEDATYTMPPLPQWYAGREAISTFFAFAFKLYDGFRLLPTAANGQPAFAAYSRSGTVSAWTAHSLQVLELAPAGIARLTFFAKPTGPSLFDAFGLPLTLTDAWPGHSSPVRSQPAVTRRTMRRSPRARA
jgi:RNA polymerase sigma-70 factor (ECF subfamily)